MVKGCSLEDLFVCLVPDNRLPNRANLLRRHVLPIEEQVCTGGCRCYEDMDNLFVSCEFLFATFGMLFAIG